MLSPELGNRLAAATGIPSAAFGTLYLSGQGTIGYWRIGGHVFEFAPVSHHLVRPDGFAQKLRLARSLNAGEWTPLIAAVMETAVVI